MEARFSYEMLVIIYEATWRRLDVKLYISGKYFDKIMHDNTQIMTEPENWNTWGSGEVINLEENEIEVIFKKTGGTTNSGISVPPFAT